MIIATSGWMMPCNLSQTEDSCHSDKNRHSATCFVRLTGEMVELLIMRRALITCAMSPLTQQYVSGFRRLVSLAFRVASGAQGKWHIVRTLGCKN